MDSLEKCVETLFPVAETPRHAFVSLQKAG
ncbi:MAG: hypothetical protein KatS3mg021_0519 [Fimbriimonadales bacterium]|nr:MAG: hypothetical protein KatS3mg021_0519 [Fimbriimonadales bacterium]